MNIGFVTKQNSGIGFGCEKGMKKKKWSEKKGAAHRETGTCGMIARDKNILWIRE